MKLVQTAFPRSARNIVTVEAEAVDGGRGRDLSPGNLSFCEKADRNERDDMVYWTLRVLVREE